MSVDNRKIQIDAVVDASGAITGFDEVAARAKKMADDVKKQGEEASKGFQKPGEEADVAAKKIERATSGIIASIQRQTAVMEAGERGGSKYYEAIANQRGVNVDALKPYLSQLDAASAKQAAATGSMNNMGVSAKQMAANLRGVPAQFTDIFTSLQGGQKPLTVLFQQGGQLKDMFGGVGNAAKAMGGYVLGLLNPFTIAAGAIGALAVAYYQGASEAEAFNKTIILSGNSIGTSSGQLANLSRAISVRTGGTQGAISEALNEIASSGKISATVMERVAQAAINMERAGGAAAAATVKEFAALGDSPVTAVVKLNEKYGFLTEAIYTQIQALTEQGRISDAAAIAQIAYADAIENRIPSLVDNLGILERGWKGISGAAKGAWDSMLYIGRPDTPEEKIAKITSAQQLREQQAVAVRRNGGTVSAQGDTTAQSGLTDIWRDINARDNAALNAGEAQRVQREAIAADTSLAALKKTLLTKEQLIKVSNDKIAKDAAAVNKARETAGSAAAYSAADIATLQQDAAKKIAGPDKKPKSTSAIDNAALGFDLEKIRKDSEELTSIYATSEKIMQAMHSAGLMDDKDYYESKSAFIRLNSAAQEAELGKEIDRIKQETSAGKDSINNAKKVVDAEAKIAKLRTESTAALTVSSIQEAAALKKIQQSYDDARSSASAYLETVATQNQRAISGIGMGDKYRTDQSATNQIQDKYTSRKTTLDDQLRTSLITKESYDTYLEIAAETYRKEVALYADRTNSIDAKNSDWISGMRDAMANYADTSKNIAAQTQEAFTGAFKGMEDALVTMVTTGKSSFSDLASSILADIARIQIKAAMAPITASLGDWMTGLFSPKASGTGAGTAAAGSLFGAPLQHSGGIVGSGEGSGFRMMEPGLFAFAPRYHSGGIASDEVPTILQKGEGVFTAGQMKAMGGGGSSVSVVVNNNGSKSEATTAESVDSRGNRSIVVTVADMVAGEVRRAGSAMNGAMRQTFGASQTLVRR